MLFEIESRLLVSTSARALLWISAMLPYLDGLSVRGDHDAEENYKGTIANDWLRWEY